VLYFDIDEATAASFPTRVAALDLQVNMRSIPMEDIIPQADILCTATSIGVGEGPLFDQLPTKEHLHINAVGADFPGKTELPLSLLRECFICPDFRQQAIIEGECQQLEEADIGDNIFECMQQPEKLAELQQQRTVFDSTGLSLEDMVVMDLFVAYAKQSGFGEEVALENMFPDAKNPYHFAKVPIKNLV